jgi:hypothetical protein
VWQARSASTQSSSSAYSSPAMSSTVGLEAATGSVRHSVAWASAASFCAFMYSASALTACSAMGEELSISLITRSYVPSSMYERYRYTSRSMRSASVSPVAALHSEMHDW